uniref:Uncharacterized protein n=1 Tax=Anguilla anguilla TaxID=7936 RepID=A0A0E9XSA3_ANGAN
MWKNENPNCKESHWESFMDLHHLCTLSPTPKPGSTYRARYHVTWHKCSLNSILNNKRNTSAGAHCLV